MCLSNENTVRILRIGKKDDGSPGNITAALDFPKVSILIQYYVIKFVNDLHRFGDFLRLLLFPPPIKLTATI